MDPVIKGHLEYMMHTDCGKTSEEELMGSLLKE